MPRAGVTVDNHNGKFNASLGRPVTYGLALFWEKLLQRSKEWYNEEKLKAPPLWGLALIR
jgi:hypothetical protein